MIRNLKNPLTENYLEMKRKVFNEFNWEWIHASFPHDYHNPNPDRHINPGFYGHQILANPDRTNRIYPHPWTNSPYLELVSNVIREIFDYNQISVDCIFRINFNACGPESGSAQETIPHTDHDFPHSNMIGYLSDVGGRTFVKKENREEYHEPHEDEIITFPGLLHWQEVPKKGRRIVFVVTYQETDKNTFQYKYHHSAFHPQNNFHRHN
tara:strand:- start:55 stop:684 length:630 start_codon:yes stop_codon:yes gene_type:complete